VTASTDVFVGRVDGPQVEKEVATDLVRHGIIALPVALIVGLIGWGGSGVASVAFASALVLANFWFSAVLLGWAARISLGFLMGMSLGSFVLRIAAISAAVWVVRDQSWVEPVPLGLTLIVAHLGLLLWETRYISASMAFPGLKPDPKE
jgi:hypothetical protein